MKIPESNKIRKKIEINLSKKFNFILKISLPKKTQEMMIINKTFKFIRDFHQKTYGINANKILINFSLIFSEMNII